MKLVRLFAGFALFLVQFLLFTDVSAVSSSNSGDIQKNHVLILDFKNIQKIPENFRSTWKDISRIPADISTLGLKDLNISGSHEFSDLELKAIHMENPIITVVVDLRQETHFFVDGNAVTFFSLHDWGNKGLSDRQILYNEKIFFEFLKKESLLIIQERYYEDPKNTEPSFMTFKHPTILSEKELVKNHGLFYIRLFVTDGMPPEHIQVDRFIEFVKTLPPRTGLYFHCRDGKGRTTTFMALYDMMHNAKNVSFEDIIKRQFYLGGVDLSNIDKSGFNPDLNQQRLNFLRQFYAYAKENMDDFSTLWSHYLNQN